MSQWICTQQHDHSHCALTPTEIAPHRLKDLGIGERGTKVYLHCCHNCEYKLRVEAAKRRSYRFKEIQ